MLFLSRGFGFFFVFLQKNIKTLRTMCTVSVKVDENVLREFLPELEDTAAIRKWVQQLIDLHIQQMELEDTETISVEEAREMTLKAVREEYSKE